VKEWLEDILDKPPQQKLLYLLGASALVWVVAWTLMLGGQWGRYSQLRQEAQAEQEKLADLQAKASNLKAVQEEVRQLDRELRAALARLPDRKEIPDLLNSLSELASTSGLLITKFRQLEEMPRDYYAEVPVELSMRGSFHQMAAFFDKVPRLNRLVNVTNIAMKAPAIVGDSVQVQASCLATTFRFLDQGERARNAEERNGKKAGGKRS
jgi:type IV pilus assembly protein PilO